MAILIVISLNHFSQICKKFSNNSISSNNIQFCFEASILRTTSQIYFIVVYEEGSILENISNALEHNVY